MSCSPLIGQQMEQRRHREEAAPAPATAAAPPVAAPSLGKDNRENKFRLDILKQKDKTTESAVASPEVNMNPALYTIRIIMCCLLHPQYPHLTYMIQMLRSYTSQRP